MELVRTDRDGVSLIQVVGKLTATKLNESLRGMVKDVIAMGVREIIIDMSEVVHMDSTGVGELISAYTAISKEQGVLHLWKLPEIIEELLDATNLLEVFSILDEKASEASVFA
jgi:anti-sigma B factor antagonist